MHYSRVAWLTVSCWAAVTAFCYDLGTVAAALVGLRFVQRIYPVLQGACFQRRVFTQRSILNSTAPCRVPIPLTRCRRKHLAMMTSDLICLEAQFMQHDDRS